VTDTKADAVEQPKLLLARSTQLRPYRKRKAVEKVMLDDKENQPAARARARNKMVINNGTELEVLNSRYDVSSDSGTFFLST